MDKFKTYIKDIPLALKNNYDCVKYRIDNADKCTGTGLHPDECEIDESTIPTRKDLNLDDPMEYTQCYFNFAPSLGKNFGGCMYETD